MAGNTAKAIENRLVYLYQILHKLIQDHIRYFSIKRYVKTRFSARLTLIVHEICTDALVARLLIF